MLLINQFVPDFWLGWTWPLLLALIGLVLTTMIRVQLISKAVVALQDAPGRLD